MHLANLDVRQMIEKVREAFFSSLPINSAQFFNTSEENKSVIGEDDQGTPASDKKTYDTENAHKCDPLRKNKSLTESGSLCNDQTISASDNTTYATLKSP